MFGYFLLRTSAVLLLLVLFIVVLAAAGEVLVLPDRRALEAFTILTILSFALRESGLSIWISQTNRAMLTSSNGRFRAAFMAEITKVSPDRCLNNDIRLPTSLPG